MKVKREVKPRPSWNEYFMKITIDVAKRSTCLRRNVGAILVKDNRIISSGYNGAPNKLKHCLELGCLRDELNIESGTHLEICRGLHAEQNALMEAARFGIETDGAICYVTHHPCIICAKLLINAGIVKIVYNEGYPDPNGLSAKFLKDAGVEVEKFKGKLNF